MALASINVLTVEWVSKNGYYPHLCSQEEFQLSPVYLWNTPRSTSGPFNLLPLHWDMKHVWFCVWPVRVESLFPTAFWLTCTHTLLALKVRHSQCSSACCRIPKLESLTWGLIPWGEHVQLSLSSHLWVTYLGMWVLTIHVPTPPSHHIVTPFLYY